MERAGRAATASELDTAPMPPRRNGEWKNGGKMRSVEGTTFDENGKSYPLARDICKGAPPKKN